MMTSKAVSNSKKYNQFAICSLKENNNNLAGYYYRLSAIELEKINNKYFAAEQYVKSYHQYKNIDIDISIEVLSKAVKLFLDRKFYFLAAKNLELLSILFFKKDLVIEAINNLQHAKRCYIYLSMENKAVNCMTNISLLLIKNNEYEKALLQFIKNFEIRNTPSTYLNIGILKLYLNYDDTVAFFRKYNQLSYKDYNIILLKLAISVKNNNKKAFIKIINNNEPSFFDWQIEILLKIYNKL